VEALKSVFGVVRVSVPVLYFGGLLYYFFDVGGSVQGVKEIGLGPTMVGLGAVTLLFCIPLVIKLVRIFAGPRSPGSGGGSTGDDDDGFDADAVVARYMARQSAEAATKPSSARPAPGGGGPVKRPGFGRRTT
jgi:hypothetical protein